VDPSLMHSHDRVVPLLIAVLLVSSAIALTAQTAPPSAQAAQWALVWSDEFTDPQLDSSKWVYDIGGGKWGNQELEYYTDLPQNVSIQDGKLAITARQEKHTDTNKIIWNFTSGRIKTLSKFTQTYGRFEARIKVPFGQGIWPAFWMLGEDIAKVDWPNCGEIDVMENIGKEPAIVHGTIHGPGYSGAGGIGNLYALAQGQRFADDFHVFAVEWEPHAIRFYVDNNLYVTRTPRELPPGKKWVYDHPFFLLINLAVGGDWPGNPDASTVFPQTMLVDYVRVYSRKEH
jgi:beta-glucanase (GH16 family)